MIETQMNKSDAMEKLSVSAHKIVFYKIDGSLREVSGTRDLTLIPENMHPAQLTKLNSSSTIVPFFDLDDETWKCFILENLVTIE